MKKHILAFGITLALAVTGATSVPAMADDDDDVAGILAGLATVAILGAILSESSDDDRKVHYRYRDYDDDHYHRPHRRDRKILPAKCFRTFETRNGMRRGFGRRCMQRNYRHFDRLPKYCLTQIRTHTGKRNFYKARCLRKEGYRLDRSIY